MLFSSKRRDVFIKTTCCFHQNDVLFSSKRRVVFIKTTCCFHQNGVMFSSKRRVVLIKTTCCFHQNDVLFSMNILMQEISITKHKPEAKIPKCKNTYKLRRAHAYTRCTGVFVFLLSQVSHSYLHHIVFQIVTGLSRVYFNK